VLVAARVTGELAAATALAAGEDAEGLLGDVLEEVEQSCREHREALALATGSTAGSA
jgi:hypothetical protein